MAPFALLHLHALMPSFAGNHVASVGRVLALLSLVQGAPWPEASWPAEAAAAVAASQAGRARAAEQRLALHVSLVNQYAASGDWPLAIAHLEGLLGGGLGGEAAGVGCGGGGERGAGRKGGEGDGGGGDRELLSLLGRLYLQAGNIDAAEDAFERRECLDGDAEKDPEVRANRGHLLVACGVFEGAIAEYGAALDLTGGRHAVAANNRATCLLYRGRLAEAIAALEAFLRLEPAAHATPAVVANLGSLYQMVEGGDAARAALEALVSTTGSEELDLSCLQPPSS